MVTTATRLQRHCDSTSARLPSGCQCHSTHGNRAAVELQSRRVAVVSSAALLTCTSRLILRNVEALCAVAANVSAIDARATRARQWRRRAVCNEHTHTHTHTHTYIHTYRLITAAVELNDKLSNYKKVNQIHWTIKIDGLKM